jgi:hypothetical protein
MTLCQRDNDRVNCGTTKSLCGAAARTATRFLHVAAVYATAPHDRSVIPAICHYFDTIESYHRLMIAPSLIVEAALVTGLAVTIAAFAKGWTFRCAMLAAIGTFLLIIAWRALANVFALNADFMPAISVGDSGCLIAGALIPYLVGRSACIATGARILPAVVGGLVGFLVNVVIL